MNDTTRLPQGIEINASLAVARPVNTLVENGGQIYRSTNAAVATYVQVTNAGGAGSAAGLQSEVPIAPNTTINVRS